MREKTKKYLDQEYKMLMEYIGEYGEQNRIVSMKKDRIKGAEELAIKIGLLSLSDIIEIKNENYKK